MKKIVFVVCLALFGFLAACNQTSQHELSAQGEYGEVRFNVFSDYREGAEDTNFNGRFDEGEFIIPGMNIRLTPVDQKGNPVGEALMYTTEQIKDPLENPVLELPGGLYKAELKLDDLLLQGGEDYSWILGPQPGPDPLEPRIFEIKPTHLFDGFFNVACEFAGGFGRQWIEVNGLELYEKSPCYVTLPEAVDDISVELVQNSGCGPIQAVVSIFYAKGKFNLPVTLSASNLPPGMTATFSPNPTSTQSTLTLTTTRVAPGTYQITIIDNRGVNVSVTVRVRGVKVNIPDAILLRSVRSTLNIPAPTDICEGDMLALTTLSLWPYGWVEDAEGLQYARNLISLGLQVKEGINLNLQPLSNLANLEWLELNWDYHTLIDLSPLSNLSNLTGLYLRHVTADLTPLSALPKLTHLEYTRSALNIEVLSKHLTYLKIGTCSFGVIDLTKLEKFEKLEVIFWDWACTNGNLTSLAKIQTLREIRFPGSDVTDLSDFVNAGGLPNGGLLDLQNAPLGLADPSDPDHGNIATLESRGVKVFY